MRFLISLVFALWAVAAAAAPDAIVIEQSSQISNTATNITTNTSAIVVSGYAKSVYFDITSYTNAANVDVDVVATGPLGARVLLSQDDVSSDTLYSTPLLLLSDPIEVRLSDSNYTGIYARVTIVFDPDEED